MGAIDEMRRRHRDRVDAIDGGKAMKSPNITDSSVRKDHSKGIGELQSDLIEACFLVGEDFRVLELVAEKACQRAGLNFELEIQSEWNRVRLDEEDEEILNRRRCDAAEAELKEAKARGEVPGQMKLVKDDGSVAEEASAVTTRKLTVAD